MDGFSGYNQIKMAPEDMEKTSFITPWGTFCYKVMPSGLKNAGATYQRAMATLFHDMMHKEIEVYVDGMIAKSSTEEEHIEDLLKLFQRLRKYRLRLNPNKCTFGVRSGKLLGFVVSQRGIEVDPDKVKVIQDMPAPKTEKQVRGFLGRLNYISRFISNMTATCEPIFKLLKKNQGCVWNEDCQKAFDNIKEYLLEPPILLPPVEGRPLIMYLTVLENSMGCVLGQHDESGRKEYAIYYLSKKFTECETRYSLLEKTCCALVWAARRLRQYMLNHTTLLISKMDPIKYVFEKPALTGRIARWQMLLSEYDIEYRAQKAVKGSVLLEYLAHQPIDDHQSIRMDFPDEDIMYLRSQDWDEPLPEEGPDPESKWVEAASYANVTKQVVVRFIKNNIIYRYGVPSKIITNNGSNLNNSMMRELCESFKIEHHNSSPYRPKMNGAVEAANKNIKKIVQKMVITYKDWHEMLPFAFHGYRTYVRTSTGATLFSLVYGMEAVLPIEVEIPSLRILMETKLSEAEWCQSRFDQLNLIEEKRMKALCHGQLYQKRMKKAFDKKVRPRVFREGDLVLKRILSFTSDSRGKWTPNFEGPYVVKKAFSGGALILATMDGEELPRPVNADVVKKYFA